MLIFLQPSNAETPIVSNPSNKLIVFNDEHPLNAAFAISFIELGTVIDSILEQFSNALSPSSWTLSFNGIFLIDEHPLNADDLIEIIPWTLFIVTNFIHPSNARVEIVVVNYAKVTVVKALHL